MHSSLLLNNNHSERPHLLFLVALVEPPVLEYQLVLRRVRYLHLPLRSGLLISFKLVCSYLMDALEAWLDEEQVGLVLDLQLRLWVEIADALALD